MNLLQHFHLAVIEYLYRRGRRAVPLPSADVYYSTRHSNRKLSIVMALSTTFTNLQGRFFGTRTHVRVRYMLSPVRMSSVTFVRPTQPVEIFDNFFSLFGTLAIH